MSRAPPQPRLGDIRSCLEGAIPAVLSTCGADGLPNVAYISQVFYVDEAHVALSFQFFNKTRRNVLHNPQATLLMLDPRTAAFWRLHIRYLRTESEGPLYEGMKAQLAGIASHSGMEHVFVLRGADVYAVRRIEPVPGEPLGQPAPPAAHLGPLRRGSDRLAQCTAMDEALDAALDTLVEGFGVEHAMVLMHDAPAGRLYTVASRGYATSGVGSEIRLGHGVIGVAGRERTPVRINHMTNAELYSQAVRHSFVAHAPRLEPVGEIPYPGLPQPRSQLAVPMQSGGRLVGMLFVESPHDMRFGYEEEDALVVLASHLAAAVELAQAGAEAAPVPAAPPPVPPQPVGTPLPCRHFPANDSIFLNGEYLIKGVAGAILWKLLGAYAAEGRSEFTNRELRLDTSLGLPDVQDNLEARLILLQRRLDEQGQGLRIEKTGRGRFRLVVGRPVRLSQG